MEFTRITPARVRRLAKGQTLLEHGISVTKTEHGDEKWALAFMYHGERIKRVVGYTSEGWNRTLVVERMSQIKADLRDGVNPLPKGRKTHLKFSELAEWYLTEMEETGGRNVARKRGHVERRLVPHFGKIVAESITEDQIERFAVALAAQGLKPSTINRVLATLGHIWTIGERRRKIRRKPCHVPKRTEPEGRTAILDPAQADALISASQEDSNPSLWLFVEFGLGTGMRSSEIVRARFDQIEWDRRRLFIPQAKAGSRLQPLTNRLVALLCAERELRKDRDGWIFPSSRARKGHVTNFNGAFRRAVVAAGLSPDLVTPHVMRHTAATNLVASGAPLPAVQQVTGHKTMVMLRRYVHLADRIVDDAASVLDRATA